MPNPGKIEVTMGPTEQQLRELAASLRPGDLAEMRKMGLPDDPFEAVLACMKHSDFYVLASHDGQPAAIYGLQHILPIGHGVPWLLTTHVVERYPVTFTRLARWVVEKLLVLSPVLIQWVDEEYEQAVRWLAGPLGFHRVPSFDLHVGPAGQYRFLAFTKRRA